MSLITWRYESRRRKGTGTKALEQSADWPRLMEHLIKLSEAHFDFETAAELRAQLNPQPITNMLETEPAYTEPAPPARKRARKKPAPSSTELERQRVWAEVRERHER